MISTLDLIFIIFLFVLFIFGLIKGFVAQFYDLIAIFLSFLLSIIFNNQLSKYVSIFPFSKNTKIYTLIFKNAEMYLTFIISFIGLYIIFKIVGIFVKPLINKSIKLLKTTSFINRIFGGLISLVKGSLIIYVISFIMLLPSFNLKSYYDQSIICKYIRQYVPYTNTYVEEIEEYSLIKLSNNNNLLSTMINGYKLGVIDQDRFIEIFDENILHTDNKSNYQLSKSDYNLLKKILKKKYALPAIQQVLDNIEVLDE